LWWPFQNTNATSLIGPLILILHPVCCTPNGPFVFAAGCQVIAGDEKPVLRGYQASQVVPQPIAHTTFAQYTRMNFVWGSECTLRIHQSARRWRTSHMPKNVSPELYAAFLCVRFITCCGLESLDEISSPNKPDRSSDKPLYIHIHQQEPNNLTTEAEINKSFT
jgi:hypothetical protein